jgi:hypothetical protein
VAHLQRASVLRETRGAAQLWRLRTRNSDSIRIFWSLLLSPWLLG